MVRKLCVLAAICAAPVGAEPVLLGSYHWQSDDPHFGGFSAIEVLDHGAGFIALSDRGRMTQGSFARDEGVITGVAFGPLEPLRGPHRAPLSDAQSDSEGLAIGPDGQIFVSFEWTHGIRSFDRVGGFGGPFITAGIFVHP